MFTSLETLRTYSLLFQYDVANVLSHTENVKRSLETSKIEKKAKSADASEANHSYRGWEGACEDGMEKKFMCPNN